MGRRRFSEGLRTAWLAALAAALVLAALMASSASMARTATEDAAAARDDAHHAESSGRDKPTPAASSPALSRQDWLIEKLDRVEKLAPGTPVEIENLHGDIYLRRAKLPELQVSATIQRAPGDRADQALLHTVLDGRHRIVVALPSWTSAARAGRILPPRRVDLSVLVPENSPLVLRTAAGLIDAQRIRNSVQAFSTHGDIRVRTNQSASATTEQGSINTMFGCQGAAPVDVKLQTLTGNVQLLLEPPCDALVQARTKGELTTDYSMTIVNEGLTKRARAEVGGATGRIEIVSDNGNVKIQRQPFERIGK